jgi:hypothetical protein
MSDLDLGDVSSTTVASIITYTRQIQTFHYMAVAILALWLWDVLLTLGTEIEYVWQGKGRLIKTLYFLVCLSLDL